MTHKEVTPETQAILDRFSEESLEISVQSCLVHSLQDRVGTNSSEIIPLLIEMSHKAKPPHYLEESTTGDRKDPVKRMESELRNGWQTGGGFRLRLDEVPIWSKYDAHTRNVRYKIHSWVMLDSLLVVDSIKKDAKALQLAIDIADDWISEFVVNRKKDDFAWYDMAVGQRATKLSYMIRRLIETNAPHNQIFRFILAAEIHFSELLDESRIAIHSNHGLFQIVGLLSLTHNLPWMSRAKNAITFGEEILEKMLGEHFANDGLHLEHSPDYHLYMVNHLVSLRNSRWLSNSFAPMMKIVDDVVESAAWLTTPNHHVIAIGDTANNCLMTKRWQGYTGSPIIGTKFFPQGGLLIKNSKIDDAIQQLVFSNQFHSRQHKHADNLNVLYNYSSRPLLVDPGTFTYQYDLPERMYCESTRAHNTVEIDGLNHSRFRKDAFGSSLSFLAENESIVITMGEVHHRRLISSSIPNNKITIEDAVEVDIKQRRIVIESASRFLAIIDIMDSKDHHKYISHFHLHPELKTVAFNSTRLDVVDDKEEKVCQIQSYDMEANPLQLEVIKGQTEPYLQGWFSTNGRELVPNESIGFGLNGSSKAWVTVFDFDKSQKAGIPYLRQGTKGKYLRFALTQGEHKFDVKIKLKPNTKPEFELQIDSESKALNLIYSKFH